VCASSDTWVRSKDEQTQQGSDRQHIEELIRSKGFHIPAAMMYVRLVHLLDERKRKELMIIYGEDLNPTGLSAADLSQGGKAFGQWPAIEKGLLGRAEKKIAIQQTPPYPLNRVFIRFALDSRLSHSRHGASILSSHPASSKTPSLCSSQEALYEGEAQSSVSLHRSPGAK
jgi:hypothetical protein